MSALRRRIRSLSAIRGVVGLPRAWDLSEPEWTAIVGPLRSLETRLLRRLEQASGRGGRLASHALGELELRVSSAFTVYDTYMDILTQRLSPTLGPLLRGCDAIAGDALKRSHPGLQIDENPLVYCDRGFGAAVVRTGIRLVDDILNPTPLIQVPYERLREKLHLTSIMHETGHEGLCRTGVDRVLPLSLRDGLCKSGVSDSVTSFFVHWSSELGPDFWSFCSAGPAHASTIREILALPPSHAFRLSMLEVHPPPYLRALCAFDWCRQTWGRGPWDAWETEWLETYPLRDAPPHTRSLFEAARLAIPRLSHLFMTTRFRALQGRTLPALFDLDALAPAVLHRAASALAEARQLPSAIRPTVGVAIFRDASERGLLSDDDVNRLMTQWLHGLGARRTSSNIVPLRTGKVS